MKFISSLDQPEPDVLLILLTSFNDRPTEGRRTGILLLSISSEAGA